MDCFADLGKEIKKNVFSDFYFFWRVHSNFLLCWNSTLPLSTGYWIDSLPGWWNSRNFGQPCQLSVYLNSHMTIKQVWICIFPSYFKTISNRIELTYKTDPGSCLWQNPADSSEMWFLYSLCSLSFMFHGSSHGSLRCWAPETLPAPHQNQLWPRQFMHPQP